MSATTRSYFGRRSVVALATLTFGIFWGVAAVGATSPALPLGSPGTETLMEQAVVADGPSSPDLMTGPNAIALLTERLVDLQADWTEDNAGNGVPPDPDVPEDGDTGGWEWAIPATSPHHTGGTSYSNLYGPIAKGIAYGHRQTGLARYETALADVRDRWTSIPHSGGGPNRAQNALIEAFVIIAETTGTSAWGDEGRALWDDLLALGYAGWVGGGTAEAWAQELSARRAASQKALTPWDINLYIQSVDALDRYFPGQGYDSDVDDMAQEIADQIAASLWDPYDNLQTYYELGIVGAVHGYATSGLPGLVADMEAYKDILVGFDPENDLGTQGTFYALMAMSDYPATADTTGIAAFTAAAFQFACGRVDGDGNVVYGTDIYPEVNAEGISAFAEIAGDVSAEPDGDCLFTGNTCEIVEVNFNRLDAVDARGISVTFELSGELDLCGTVAASILEGTWLSAYSGQKYFYVIDNGSDSYTVDMAILGDSPTACGVTTSGTLFTVAVAAAGGDGTGSLTVNEVIVRGCQNEPLPGAPGAVANLTIDFTPPAELADLAAAQEKLANDVGGGSDGRTFVNLSWTMPAEPDAATIAIYREGFGDYPEYDDGTGVEPTSPLADLVDGSVPAGGTTYIDHPGARDFWYYEAYVTDDCGNTSGASLLTGGTLNYHLGDVTPTGTPGDNDVATDDVSRLAFSYGTTIAHPPPDAVADLDVGPTTDYSLDGRPSTDNEIEFEDLMMFAINFGNVSMTQLPSWVQDVPGGHPRLELITEQVDAEHFRVRLDLAGNPGTVKGIHAVIRTRGAEMVTVDQGALLDEHGEAIFFTHLPENGVGIHTAILGEGEALHGQGEVASVLFRGRADATVHLVLADLRDTENRFLGDPPQTTMAVAGDTELGSSLPARFELVGAEPNPFNPQTRIRFRLPAETRVSVRIYDVGGHLVRALYGGALPAGEHGISWDGRDNRGHLLGTGMYIVSIQAGEINAVEKLVLLK